LFVSDYKTGRVSRIDPTTRTVVTSPHVCAGAQGMAPAGKVIWVTCTPANVVVSIDTRKLRRLGQVTVAGEPDAITAHNGRLYVAATEGPRLVELVPKPGAPTISTVRVLGSDTPLHDSANVDLLVQGNRFWITSPNGGRVVSGLVPS
jgi:DNA-binding beta-propeller fold protein YncE